MKRCLATALIQLLLLSLLGVAGTVMAAQPPKKGLNGLVELLARQPESDWQLDILRGMHDGLEGRRNVAAPVGWKAVAAELSRSTNREIRQLTQSLSLIFGQAEALPGLRLTLLNQAASPEDRRAALNELLAARDPELPPSLIRLLSDPVLRQAAIRGLSTAEHPEAATSLLRLYPSLDLPGRREVLQTLASRLSYARALPEAWRQSQIAARELPVELVRQLRRFNEATLNEALDRHWGRLRESPADKLKEIQRCKTLVESRGYGDAQRGRAIFSRTCQQCHTLFGEGGKVGPELTGANRTDLDYLLQNIIDPNALIPNDYRTTLVETRDGRALAGLISRQDTHTISLLTLNELVVLPRSEIQELSRSELSLMPEGLFQALGEDDIRDLLSYLRQPRQVPLTVPTP